MTAPISNGPTTHGYTTMRDATSPSLSEVIFSLNNGSKLELSMNVTLAVLPIGAAISGVSAYSRVINPSELEVDRQQHRRNAYMVARQRGLSEREWYKVVEAAKQR